MRDARGGGEDRATRKVDMKYRSNEVYEAEEKKFASWRSNAALRGVSGKAKRVLTRLLGEHFFRGDTFDREAAVSFFSKPVLSLLKYRGLGKKTLIEILAWLNLPEPNFKEVCQPWMRGLSTRSQNALLNANLESEILAKDALLSGSLRRMRNVGRCTILELENHFKSTCKCPKCGHEFSVK